MTDAFANTVVLTNERIQRRFLVRVVEPGAPKPLVEIFDYTYSTEVSKSSFGPCGQRVAQYYLETLLDPPSTGLLLDGGNRDVWFLTPANCAQMRAFLVQYTR